MTAWLYPAFPATRIHRESPNEIGACRLLNGFDEYDGFKWEGRKRLDTKKEMRRVRKNLIVLRASCLVQDCLFLSGQVLQVQERDPLNGYEMYKRASRQCNWHESMGGSGPP